MICALRFALNIKGLPYRTEWVEYPDIAPLIKSFGLPPNLNSYMPYTLPTIYDPRTKRAIMDSMEIAKYLDDEYPETPAVLPKEVRAYQVSSIRLLLQSSNSYTHEIFDRPPLSTSSGGSR